VAAQSDRSERIADVRKRDLLLICREQRDLIRELRAEMKGLQRAALDNLRLALTISAAFRETQEDEPDEFLCERLDAVICDLSDQVARIEEHLV